jgi:hypothetical protein
MRIQVGARADDMMDGLVVSDLGCTRSCEVSDLVPGGVCRQRRRDFVQFPMGRTWNRQGLSWRLQILMEHWECQL